MKKIFWLICLCLSLVSCSSRHRSDQGDYLLLGQQDFILDSLLIREGKAAIQGLEGHEVFPLPEDAFEEYEDIITEGDVFNIALFHPKRIDLMEAIAAINTSMGGFTVVDGMITLPCMDPVHVAGLTLKTAREKIREACREIDDIDIFISFKDRQLNRIELTGLVERSNIPVNGRMHLYEVLALAGLPSDANLYASYVMRDGIKLNVDLYKLLHKGDMCQNIVMKGGDKIFIASPGDGNVLVMGEVRNPRAVAIPYGHLSLREALAIASGIPFTGNPNNILVIRGDVAFPKIYVISWNFTLHQPNNNLLLIPGDVVYVLQKPITKWNIFMSQLMPTVNAFLAGNAIYNVTR